MPFDLVSPAFVDDAARWTAVLARDPRADGAFVYAVASTGIYCRTICSARRPKRENARFFATCAAAERAGFRACRLCRPDAALAAPLASAAAALRPAAALFCDMVGYSAFAAKVRADAALTLTAALQRALTATVTAHGGLVQGWLGDGLMAVFGAEAPRMDDPARALACGFALIEAAARLDAPVPVRLAVGIDYGPVALAKGCDGPLIVGDTVNAAKRIETLTRRLGAALAASDAVVRACPPTLAGRLSPVGVRRLKGVRPRMVWAAPAA